MEFLDSMTVSTIVWSVIAILEVVFRLTPSNVDNSILNKVIWIVEKLIPNNAKDKSDKLKLFKKR
tara:strand:+ start:293 stop:487 length:195 start_codon:yes stop_codon:yes gene_type:complete